MTINELRKRSKMNIKEFAEYFGIPYKTVHKWDNGERECSEYLIKLMEYKLENEGLKSPSKVYKGKEVVVCSECIWWKGSVCPFNNEIEGYDPKEDDYCYCAQKRGEPIG